MSSAPISEISTRVGEWRSPGDARRGFDRSATEDLKYDLAPFGVKTSVTRGDGIDLGVEHTAISSRYRITRARIVYCLSERVREGRYNLSADACGTNRASTAHLAPILIRRLDQRLELALASKLHGKPIRGPRYPEPGPPAHGPKPAALALRPSDLPAKTRHGSYDETYFRSEYNLALAGAGPYAHLYQDIYLAFNSPMALTEAAETLDLDTHTRAYDNATAPVRAHTIHLHGIPDHALAQIVTIPTHSGTSYHGHIVLLHGPWYEFITAESNAPSPTSELTKLARLAANRLNSGLGS